MLIRAISTDPAPAFAADIRAGLTHRPQKELPSKYLYDEIGSALFEVITALPEYGVTRADERLVRRHAADIVARLPQPVAVAELGSGSGKKTRQILEVLCRTQPTAYYPIEISHTALALCERELADIDAISIVGCEREYLDGLAEVTGRRQQGEHFLVLFLGSTIGNFRRLAATRFLHDVRRMLRPGDSLLLGVDLEKPVARLIDAYDDALGVTAAFNLNILARINRELNADFDLRQFKHLARFNPEARSIEMHLRSMRNQEVTIPRASLSITLAEGETIWTESSHKYSPTEILRMANDAGFRCDAQWIDDEWPFAENLLIAE
jgi:L-histidine N-alpha-methyltransferase